MHLFEAMMGLHQTIGHPQALPRAAKLRELLVGKFLDPQTQTLREYFTDDWQPAAGPDGDVREPGHHAEWVWLIRTHERVVGQRPDPLASALLDRATATAETATGFLLDEVGPRGELRRDSRRLWPQTELAKAWLAESENGRPGAEAAARKTLRNIAAHYLAGPKPGLWFDQFDATGQVMSQHVPASSLYHVFCAIAEADRVLNAGKS
jgi:mannose-6-phosphate isomerase